MVGGCSATEGLKMRLSTLKFEIRTMVWFLPFISLMIYAIFLNYKNEEDNQEAREEKKIQLKTDLQYDVELPVISVCSRNQFSQRDADKILEMEEWRDIHLFYYWMRWYYSNITLSYSEFMSVFRNFAMYNMNPDEIENFTEDQKEFLDYHKTNFGRLIKNQVCQQTLQTYSSKILIKVFNCPLNAQFFHTCCNHYLILCHFRWYHLAMS